MYRLVWFCLGLPLVEFVGWLWHWSIEHYGLLGEALRKQHYVHHEVDYPAEDLRPQQDYQSAHDWSWYLLSAITLSVLVALSLTGLLPWRYMIALSAGAVLYARCVVSIMHDLYHLPNCRLSRFAWFRELVRLHDIHHYARGNYGIVFFWFDRLFGTYVEDMPSTPLNVFPGFHVPPGMPVRPDA